MMNFWLIEKWNDIGKFKCDQDQYGYDLENQFVGGVYLWNCVDFIWFVCLYGLVNLFLGEEQCYQCCVDE